MGLSLKSCELRVAQRLFTRGCIYEKPSYITCARMDGTRTNILSSRNLKSVLKRGITCVLMPSLSNQRWEYNIAH